MEETHLGLSYEDNKTPIFLIECSGHVLNYMVYAMLLIGTTKRHGYFIVPFIAHCIAGISLFLGFTEASFYLGLGCFKDCKWDNCKFTLLSVLSIVILIFECVFLTYSRKFYLEIKKNELSDDYEGSTQEEGLLLAK